MAHITINSFTSWQFSDEEQSLAYHLNDLQIKALQNEIAILAERKIALKFDPTNPIEFAQQEAEIAGAIGTLQYLISRSNETHLV